MKKIITLILMATMLVACGQTNDTTTPEEPEVVETEGTEVEGVAGEFINAWNNAGTEARTCIILNEETASTVLFHLINEDGISAKIAGFKKAAEKVGETLDLTGINETAEAIKAHNANFVTAIADFFANTTFESLEDGSKLVSSLAYKFEVSNPELVLDPDAISFIFYDDLHIEVTNKEEVSYYTISQESFDALKAICDGYLAEFPEQDPAYEIQKLKF